VSGGAEKGAVELVELVEHLMDRFDAVSAARNMSTILDPTSGEVRLQRVIVDETRPGSRSAFDAVVH
jgi:hypothetical protein